MRAHIRNCRSFMLAYMAGYIHRHFADMNLPRVTASVEKIDAAEKLIDEWSGRGIQDIEVRGRASVELRNLR
jgi:hypothetical protein